MYTLVPCSRCCRANSTPRCRFSRLGTPVRSTVLSLSCSTPAACHSCISDIYHVKNGCYHFPRAEVLEATSSYGWFCLTNSPEIKDTQLTLIHGKDNSANHHIKAGTVDRSSVNRGTLPFRWWSTSSDLSTQQEAKQQPKVNQVNHIYRTVHPNYLLNRHLQSWEVKGSELTSAELQKYLVSYFSFMVMTPRTFSVSTSCDTTIETIYIHILVTVQFLCISKSTENIQTHSSLFHISVLWSTAAVLLTSFGLWEQSQFFRSTSTTGLLFVNLDQICNLMARHKLLCHSLCQ